MPNVQNAAPVYLVDEIGNTYSAGFGSGTVATLETAASGTPTITPVATSTSTVQLCAASTTRRAVFIYNAAATVLYVAFAATATTTAYTTQIGAGVLMSVDRATYAGAISAILGTGTGSAQVTVTF